MWCRPGWSRSSALAALPLGRAHTSGCRCRPHVTTQPSLGRTGVHFYGKEPGTGGWGHMKSPDGAGRLSDPGFPGISGRRDRGAGLGSVLGLGNACTRHVPELAPLLPHRMLEARLGRTHALQDWAQEEQGRAFDYSRALSIVSGLTDPGPCIARGAPPPCARKLGILVIRELLLLPAPWGLSEPARGMWAMMRRRSS